MFSKNGAYLAVGLRYQAGIKLYKSTGGGTLTPIAITPTGNMATWQSAAGFSPDGSLLVVASYYRLYVYTIDAATDTFTYNNDFDSVTWGTPSFSPDSQFLTINSGILFKRDSTAGATFTRITAPAPFSPAPTGTAMTTVFRNNQ